MKRLLALMLCIAMLVCSINLVAFAETIATDRAINVVANYSERYADEEVEISIVIEGNDLANAQWELTYDPTHFELMDTDVIAAEKISGRRTFLRTRRC